MSFNEADSLSKQLNAGRLPVPLEILYDQTVSPILGAGFIDMSVKAGVIGIIIGTLAGIFVALNITSIVPWIESLLGFQIMPSDVYYISQIPSELRWRDVIWIDIAAACGWGRSGGGEYVPQRRDSGELLTQKSAVLSAAFFG